jgi:hypothetical protein
LKGGGNNLGVVTRFDLAAFPQGQILAGDIAQDISYRDEVFKAFADIANAPEYDPYASLVMGTTFNATSKVWNIDTTAVYTKPVMNPPVYDELLSIPTTTSTLHLTNLSSKYFPTYQCSQSLRVIGRAAQGSQANSDTFHSTG